MIKYSGKTIFEGFANGKIKQFSIRQKKVDRKFTSIKNEFDLFLKAREEEIILLDNLYEKTKSELGEEEAKLFATHKIMATDFDFEDLVRTNIEQNKIVEVAVLEASKTLATMLSQLDEPYMKARSADAIEIGKSIYNILTGNTTDYALTQPTILVCEDLESNALMQFDKKMLKGLVLTKGNLTSHVSIFARTNEIPSICMAKDVPLDGSLNGKQAILDSTLGQLLLDITDDDIESYKKKTAEMLNEKEQLKKYIGMPSKTKDGIATKIYCNIGSSDETKDVLANDGEGVGLFRSEFIYLKQNDYPTEDFQFNIYKTALESMKGKEVIVRTFDIGADKKVDYFNLPTESNPALGYRSIRICLDRPEMFKTQLRALYRASVYGKLSIMIPMIVSINEINFIKKCIDEVKNDLDKSNIKYDKDVKVGIMIETPAAAITSDILAPHVDFFSIGTNDLIQYTLACDRTNENLSKIYDPYNKGILRLIKMTIENAHKHGKTVAMCGEMARDPKVIPFLLGLHIDELSLSPSYVLKTRKIISELDTKKIDIEKYVR